MNRNNPHISFVIPAYNCAGTLVESVDSIMNSNFESGDEIIIVNDCSTDDTATIIAQLQNKYRGIIAIKNEANKGCPATRNVGISRATNKLIFNLDSDNILAPHSIPKLKAYLIEKKADVAAFARYHYFQKDPQKITHQWVYEKDTMSLADFLSGPINPGPGGNFLYTKASWKKIGGYWEYGKGLHEAWGFTLKQLGNGSKFVVLPESYYFHRYGHDSLFVTESKKQNEGARMATKMILNIINLIDSGDAAYIQSQAGADVWYEDLRHRPIRTKSGEAGYTGYVLRTSSPRRGFGIFRIKKLMKKIFASAHFIAEYRSFKKMNDGRFPISWRNRKPILSEKTAQTNFDAHYILHPAWAARILAKIRPARHVDIASTLTFSTIVSAFIPVDFYDYRPAPVYLDNLQSRQADLMKLPFADNSIPSLSCMHTVEHIGLGRYGDQLDPTGDLKAIIELKRVTAPGGTLLFVVPIGNPKIVFNAHRIYSYRNILSLFDGFELKEFSLIPDNALSIGMVKNAPEALCNAQKYGCGCFWFVKK